MKYKLIGRRDEQEVLRKAEQSDEAELVAVIGRRRVGKTFLIRSVYEDNFDFELTGQQNASNEIQLENFRDNLSQLSEVNVPIERPKNWTKAFQLLRQHLEGKQGNEKQILFFDELPWLATHKSGFLGAFGYFWNNWAERQNIVIIICGSAASWMIQKVVNNKGGLHNRITKRIFLKPFNLKETEHYLIARNFHFDRYHILQIYMAMGGIPHYLKEIEGNKSATQNIDSICFSEGGLLNREFERLYPALFENAESHVQIVRALAKKNKGLTRQEIVKQTKLTDGGGLTKVLEELTQSGFISKYFPFGKKKKNLLYRLTDEYSLFYLKFIENKVHEEKTVWLKLSQTQFYKTWSGYAFESICLKHIPQIKKAMGISGIYSQSASFFYSGNDQIGGTQIDLVIDRNDHVIDLVEMKFYNNEFTITKEYATKLRRKMEIFKAVTKSKKHLNTVLITTFGLKNNQYVGSLIAQELRFDVLFE